jgi:plasmid stability protein
MPMTLTLPDELAALLQPAATAQGRTMEEVALDILRAGLPDKWVGGARDRDDLDLDFDAVVAAIRALPRNPQAVRPGRGSLADALADKLTDEPFDLAAWEVEWAVVEAEMAARERADDRAEGRA